MATKILAIDDSKTMRLAIKITFAAEDAEVTSVSKGSDAVARIKAKQGGYDVVLVDAKLAAGEPSGYDVCRALKQDPATAKIPVVLLVSNQTGVDQDQLTAAGGDDFIAKPFDSQELIDKVAGVQTKPAARPSSGASPVAAAPTPAPAPAPAPAPRAATGPRPAVAAPSPTSSTPPLRAQRAVNRTQMGMPAPAAAAASPPSKPVAAAKPVAAKPAAAKPAVAKPVVAKPAVAKPVATKPVVARPAATGRPISGAVTAVPPSRSGTSARPATPAPPVRSAVPAPTTPAAAAPKPAAAMARPVSGPARAAASTPTGGADIKIPVAIPIPFTAADSLTPGMVERLQQAAGAGGVDPKVAEALASLSREVIERIVWEVVPELAESIIREQQAKSA